MPFVLTPFEIKLFGSDMLTILGKLSVKKFLRTVGYTLTYISYFCFGSSDWIIVKNLPSNVCSWLSIIFMCRNSFFCVLFSNCIQCTSYFTATQFSFLAGIQ